jgi:hypothetical protein
MLEKFRDVAEELSSRKCGKPQKPWSWKDGDGVPAAPDVPEARFSLSLGLPKSVSIAGTLPSLLSIFEMLW